MISHLSAVILTLSPDEAKESIVLGIRDLHLMRDDLGHVLDGHAGFEGQTLAHDGAVHIVGYQDFETEAVGSLCLGRRCRGGDGGGRGAEGRAERGRRRLGVRL